MKPQFLPQIALLWALLGLGNPAFSQPSPDAHSTSSLKLHLTEPLFAWAKLSWEQSITKGVSVQATAGWSWKSLQPQGRILRWIWVNRRAFSVAAGPRFNFVREFRILDPGEPGFPIRWYFQPQVQFLYSDFDPYTSIQTDSEFSDGDQYWKTLKVKESKYGLHFQFGYYFNRGHFLCFENYVGFGLNWIVRDEQIIDFDPRVTPAIPFFSTGFLDEGRQTTAKVALQIGWTLNFDFAALQ